MLLIDSPGSDSHVSRYVLCSTSCSVSSGSEPGSSEAALPEGDASEEKPTVSCGKETSQEEKQDVGSHVSESSVSSEESTISPDKVSSEDDLMNVNPEPERVRLFLPAHPQV